MSRAIWIPVGGTLAAALAVVVAGKTEAWRDPGPPPLPPPARSETPETKPRAERPRPEERATYTVTLREDGALEVAGRDGTFATAEELLSALAPEGGARPVVIVGNASPQVTEEALDAVIEKLRARCDVHRVHRGG
ncbi:MAG: hypothetical protein ACREID_09385 [Planctomycetota bacterium]